MITVSCSERVNRKLEQTKRAFEKLSQIGNLNLPEEILYEVSAKRFEYTYETLWKTIRLFLLEEKGIECNSPMDCFKTLYSVNLIPEEFSEKVPQIVRMRNSIVHIYDFSLARDVYTFIKETVIPCFEAIIKNLEKACRGSD